jgi:hypothetical protein
MNRLENPNKKGRKRKEKEKKRNGHIYELKVKYRKAVTLIPGVPKKYSYQEFSSSSMLNEPAAAAAEAVGAVAFFSPCTALGVTVEDCTAIAVEEEVEVEVLFSRRKGFVVSEEEVKDFTSL